MGRQVYEDVSWGSNNYSKRAKMTFFQSGCDDVYRFKLAKDGFLANILLTTLSKLSQLFFLKL